MQTTCSVDDYKYSSANSANMKNSSTSELISGSTFTSPHFLSIESSSSPTLSVASDLNTVSSRIDDAAVTSQLPAVTVKPLVMKFNFSKKKK